MYIDGKRRIRRDGEKVSRTHSQKVGHLSNQMGHYTYRDIHTQIIQWVIGEKRFIENDL